jgi:4-aminobutyrate aminotransferase
MPRNNGRGKPRIQIRPPGKKAKEILKRDFKIISSCLTRGYPLVIERGYGSYIEDVDGNVYLDFSSGITVDALGHSNPEVNSAITRQLQKISHAAFSDFYAELPVEFAENIVSLMPKDLDTVFFVNSGTEANEAAMKVARHQTKRPNFLAFHGSFHGRTYGSLSLTASKAVHKAGFGPFLPVEHAPYAYCYRCPFDKKEESCDLECARYIEDVIFKKHSPGDDFAALFVEPIQGEGGYIVPPAKFHRELNRICEEQGILLVADEVQTGVYRTGKFLASEHFGLKPDIVTLAKALGGGLPLGAMISREKVMTWKVCSGAYANTFGGNMLACAAGKAALEYMGKNDIPQGVIKKGKLALDFLKELKGRHEVIGDVRGKGLMIGVELVKDRKTKAPAIAERNTVILRAFQEGLLLLPAGESAVRIVPPLNISEEDLVLGLELFEKILP